jgi:hypothetical protein
MLIAIRLECVKVVDAGQLIGFAGIRSKLLFGSVLGERHRIAAFLHAFRPDRASIAIPVDPSTLF